MYQATVSDRKVEALADQLKLQRTVKSFASSSGLGEKQRRISSVIGEWHVPNIRREMQLRRDHVRKSGYGFEI